jgi:hypothetical protein
VVRSFITTTIGPRSNPVILKSCGRDYCSLCDAFAGSLCRRGLEVSKLSLPLALISRRTRRRINSELSQLVRRRMRASHRNSASPPIKIETDLVPDPLDSSRPTRFIAPERRFEFSPLTRFCVWHRDPPPRPAVIFFLQPHHDHHTRHDHNKDPSERKAAASPAQLRSAQSLGGLNVAVARHLRQE